MWKYILPIAVLGALGTYAVTRNCPSCHTRTVATPANADVSLEGVDLGKFVTGPKIQAADLKGKAVVFEYWGDECPPCLASIPHLCETQKKHGRDKLIVVANQVWTQDVEAAKKAFENRAPKGHQVSVINHGAIKRVEIEGVPHAFVFNADGNLRWDGHPMDGAFDKAVDEAVETVKAVKQAAK